MDPLVRLAVIAAAVLLLHVVVAAYVYRTASSAAGSSSPEEAGRAASDDAVTGGEDVPGESRVPCGICGTPNDPSYRFCRRCVADLSGDARVGGELETT